MPNIWNNQSEITAIFAMNVRKNKKYLGSFFIIIKELMMSVVFNHFLRYLKFYELGLIAVSVYEPSFPILYC